MKKQNQPLEIWKDITGYEGYYQVSNYGRVKSLERWVLSKNNKKMPVKEKILKLQNDKDGYKIVELNKNSIGIHFRVHRLVALTFISNPENKPEVNHKNGIKFDNRLGNLEWNTDLENRTHAIESGLQIQKGIGNGRSKLTEEQVLEIRLIGKSIFATVLAKKYNVSNVVIGNVIKRKSWKHI